jgi:outer membrane receptor protein involved in Fe transport
MFSAYTLGERVYDYDVTFVAVSPYVQAEFSPVANMRFSAGLRADRMRYDYDDLMTAPPTARHRRPEDARRAFTHFSPKLGWTWQASDRVNVFGSYRHAFRAPSEGQLFRQGSALNTVDLEPVRADNLEAGVRVALRPGLSFDVSAYQLDKRDDILSFRDPLDGATQSVNAGHTRHRGVEAGFDAAWQHRAGLKVAYSYAKHTYEEWVVDPRAGIDYSGFEQEVAPRHMGTATLRVSPVERAHAGLELVYLGSYWLDAANSTRYGGHALLNLRGEYELMSGLQLFGRVLNLTDRTYAESGSYTQQRGREFAPGRPRTFFAGVQVEWRAR